MFWIVKLLSTDWKWFRYSNTADKCDIFCLFYLQIVFYLYFEFHKFQNKRIWINFWLKDENAQNKTFVNTVNIETFFGKSVKRIQVITARLEGGIVRGGVVKQQDMALDFWCEKNTLTFNPLTQFDVLRNKIIM